ncbi:MAG: leucyl/phenylalanyl-tRNA--protein transferase [Spirochaetes bacterium]|nr:leucyl/phenylalanyl-tRNA--protein transferase [Spirochaetota bacterium]
MPHFTPGPDPLFPYLGELDYFDFPDPLALPDSVVAVGGNLSPGMLLSAYCQGIFPWYSEGEPVIWQSPDPRLVIFPENLRISASMRKILARGVFEITFNRDFAGVIKNCAQIYRPNQGGTWITDDIISAYSELHILGRAVSAEAWLEGELVGGCYGVLVGDVFCGESMFAKKSNASKAAFLSLAMEFFAQGLAFVDCQTPSRHLESLGGTRLPRRDFLRLLSRHVPPPGSAGAF